MKNAKLNYRISRNIEMKLNYSRVHYCVRNFDNSQPNMNANTYLKEFQYERKIVYSLPFVEPLERLERVELTQ